MVYKNGKIDFISTSEGRALRPGTVQQDRGYDMHATDTTNLFWRYEYHLNDHLGNLRVACRCAEKAEPKQDSRKDGYPPYIVQQLMYDAWGVKIPVFNPDRQEGSPEHRNKFNGKEYLSDLGWYEYGARMYDPTIGKFSTIDPLADHPNQVSFTPYNAFWNNPVIYTDPDGRCPSCPQGEDAANTYAAGAQVSNKDGSWTWTGSEWQTNPENPSSNTSLSQGRTDRGFLGNAADSDKPLTSFLYNLANDGYLALQGFDFDLLGEDHTNPLTGKKAFTNLDRSANYKPISGLVNTLSFAIPVTKAPAGLGAMKSLNAAQFSKTFTGTLSRLSSSNRGTLNRYFNKGIDWVNSQISGGKGVFKAKAIIVNKEEE